MTPAQKLSKAKAESRKVKPRTRQPRGVIYKCRLAELREGLGLSQRDICRAVGITPSGYHKVEQGYEVVLTTAIKLAEFYGLSITEIWKPKKHRLS